MDGLGGLFKISLVKVGWNGKESVIYTWVN